MSEININLLGVGAIKLSNTKFRLFVDAVNSLNAEVELLDHDILLFTHADDDHFCGDKFPDIRNLEINVLGPPSIACPLLQHKKVEIEQLKIEYPPTKKQTTEVKVKDLTISFFQSEHFIDWNPIHCSYLIETDTTKIYITGDSYLNQKQEALDNVDCIVCNLVDKGFITKSEDPSHAVHHHLSYLLNLNALYHPRLIVANHLIDFDGTVQPEALKRLVEDYDFRNIKVPCTVEETIII